MNKHTQTELFLFFLLLPQRYVDIILNLIRIAGDYVSEEVWYRVIQIVINRDDVQGKGSICYRKGGESVSCCLRGARIYKLTFVGCMDLRICKE